MRLCFVVLASIAQENSQVDVGFALTRGNLQCQPEPLFRFGQAAEGLEAMTEISESLRKARLKAQRRTELLHCILEQPAPLQYDPEIVMCFGEAWVELERPSQTLFGLVFTPEASKRPGVIGVDCCGMRQKLKSPAIPRQCVFRAAQREECVPEIVVTDSKIWIRNEQRAVGMLCLGESPALKMTKCDLRVLQEGFTCLAFHELVSRDRMIVSTAVSPPLCYEPISE